MTAARRSDPSHVILRVHPPPVILRSAPSSPCHSEARTPKNLNQSRSGIYMDGGINTGLSGSEELLCPSLQDSPAPLLDLFPPRGQLGEEVTQFFLHGGSGAQAQVRGGLFPCPVSDRLGSIEIRTVSRQAHQSQAQAGGSRVGTQGVTMMDWSVVPDDVQWSGVLIPQLLQEGSGGLGVAVPLQFHNLHSPVSRHTAE